MPPRFSYWTIIAGGLPTAFRAAERDELLPTFTRLKQKQPDAEMKWFARGKLWDSPEAAQSRDRQPGGKGRPSGPRETAGQRPNEPRGRDWRPGGTHRDPRQPFKDAKKARNQHFKAEKFARRSRHEDRMRERPHGDPLAPERRTGQHGSRQGERAETPRPRKQDNRRRDTRGADHRNRDDRHDRGTKPGSRRPFAPRGDRQAAPPRNKPHGDKLTRPPHPRDDRDRASFDRGGADRTRSSFGGRDRTDRDRPFNRRDKTDRAPSSSTRRDQGSRAASSFKPRNESGRDRFRDGRGEGRDEGRATYRGTGHGDNSWKPRPTQPASQSNRGAGRPFSPKRFDRERGGGTEEPQPPPHPRGPNREPKPSEQPEPSRPPRPPEPVTPPPGPPERGRLNRNKRPR